VQEKNQAISLALEVVRCEGTLNLVCDKCLYQFPCLIVDDKRIECASVPVGFGCVRDQQLNFYYQKGVRCFDCEINSHQRLSSILYPGRCNGRRRIKSPAGGSSCAITSGPRQSRNFAGVWRAGSAFDFDACCSSCVCMSIMNLASVWE
jgi:hypothetical protein